MLTIGICSGKGGTAKTTTTVGLAWSLQDLGLRVLVVDIDPQGHSTTCMGVDRTNLQATTGTVLLGKVAMKDAIVKTDWGPDLCPTNEASGAVSGDLDKGYYSHEKLAGALETIEDTYDVVLLDCPPSLKTLTANAIFAADWIITPTELSFLSYERTIDLANEAPKICVKAGPPPISVLIVKFDGRERVLNEVLLDTIKKDEAITMETRIPASTKVKQAQSAGMPVQVYAPNSAASKAFKKLAEEVKLVMQGGSRVAA